MTRIAIFSDLHVNLPALEAFLAETMHHGCDKIVHLGDAVAISPFPMECLERIGLLSNVSYVMGSHDE